MKVLFFLAVVVALALCDDSCDFGGHVHSKCKDKFYSEDDLYFFKRPKFTGFLTCRTHITTYNSTTGDVLSTNLVMLNISTCYNSSCGCYHTTGFFNGFPISNDWEYGVPGRCATCWEANDGVDDLYFNTITHIGEVQIPVGVVKGTDKVKVVQVTIPTFNDDDDQIRELVPRTIVNTETGYPVSSAISVCDLDDSYC